MNRRPADNQRRHDRWDDGPNRRGDVERLERESFILLQHVYTVTGASPEVPVNAARIGIDLGFGEDETRRLVRYLSWVGYMKESAAGPHLALAEEGIQYLEHGAGRRHTVRAGDRDIPIPVFLSR